MSRAPVRAWGAMALANARYWSGVAPFVQAQLGCWERRALSIPDPMRRALAVGKLREERFNVQLAATLATTVPRAQRRRAALAMVALQVAYDYEDALGERALEPRLERAPGAYRDDYLAELRDVYEGVLAGLPSAAAVAEARRVAGARCARAQALMHEASRSGDERLREWAAREARGTNLGWAEWLAGAQASVLCLHALIALATDPHATPEEAERLDELYLTLGTLTMLDSLVDRDEDARAGERGYIRFYDSPAQMGIALAAAAREGLRHAERVRGSAHHTMTLAGIVAYYASAPHAASPLAQPVMRHVRSELGALVIPALGLMRVWRVAKRLHGVVRCVLARAHPGFRARAHPGFRERWEELSAHRNETK